MRELVPALWDDKELAAGHRVSASKTVTLGWQGKWVELDLTGNNESLLFSLVDPWMQAGRTPDKTPRPSARHSARRSRAYYQGLREWAAAQDIKIHQEASGKYAYPAGLRERYDEYLASQAAGDGSS